MYVSGTTTGYCLFFFVCLFVCLFVFYLKIQHILSLDMIRVRIQLKYVMVSLGKEV